MATAAIAEEVAENLEEVAQATRAINAHAVKYFGVGVVVGAALGFWYGYKFNREKLYAEAFEETKREVDAIRAAYAAREKPQSAEEIVTRRGYAAPPPEGDDIRPPATAWRPPAPVPNVEEAKPARKKEHTIIWNYEEELALRTPNEPYVIHQEEFHESTDGEDRSDYQKVVYTYWAIDDVLTDETERPLPHADLIVGQNNLRFGHGSDDPDVVFVRNPERKLEMEICRIQESYERNIMGIEQDETS